MDVIRLNHFAMRMRPAEFDDRDRQEIADLDVEVFGSYGFTPDEPGDPIIRAFDEFGRCLDLVATEPLVRAAPAHVAVRVESPGELDATLRRARACATRDACVRATESVTEPQRRDRGRVTLRNCSLGYVLPVTVELQHIEFTPTGA